MAIFIVHISKRDMSVLRAEGTEYYELTLSDERIIAEAIATYPVKEAGNIDPVDIAVIQLTQTI